jgi:serine protease Do
MVENKTGADTTTAPVSLEILTGPARGTASWLSGTALDISLNPADMIRVAEVGSEPLENGVVARLHRSGDSYEIEALDDNPLWINGTRIDSKQLEQRDLIEFGEQGPLTRYRVHRQGDRIRRSLGDMFDD